MSEPASGAHLPQAASIRRARPEEAALVADLVRASFATVARELHIDIPPLFETADDVSSALDSGEVVLLGEWDCEPVGTVRGETIANGSVVVRRLAVLPEFRRHGLARTLMVALEDAYPQADRFELFTGAEAAGPIALYRSLGYTEFEPAVKHDFPLVYLEKCR